MPQRETIWKVPEKVISQRLVKWLLSVFLGNRSSGWLCRYKSNIKIRGPPSSVFSLELNVCYHEQKNVLQICSTIWTEPGWTDGKLGVNIPTFWFGCCLEQVQIQKEDICLISRFANLSKWIKEVSHDWATKSSRQSNCAKAKSDIYLSGTGGLLIWKLIIDDQPNILAQPNLSYWIVNTHNRPQIYYLKKESRFER